MAKFDFLASQRHSSGRLTGGSRKEWWTFFLAVLAAHMVAQLQTGVPVWTAAGWFLTNSSEALIGAYCITRFSDPGRRLDSVRGFSSLWLLVSWLPPWRPHSWMLCCGNHWLGTDYWPLSLERFSTNALAALTIVPPIVALPLKPHLVDPEDQPGSIWGGGSASDGVIVWLPLGCSA